MWFDKLCQDWERAFSEKQLHEGRACYRDGGIREIELTANDAIIHGTWDDEESYAVVEWNKNKLQVRGSTEDIGRGKCLAAAGLYEIEELIAEEISPLPVERKTPEPEPTETAKTEDKSEGEASVAPLSDSRELQLDFSASEQGLAFAVYWLDNGVKVAALGESALTGDRLSATDREKLIRLANFARKAGFRFSGASNCYLLARLDEVPGFLGKELARWRKYFACLLTPDALALKNGIRELNVAAEAHELSNGAFELNWRFELDGESIAEREAQNRFFRGDNLVFLKGRGLVRLSNRQTEALADWRSSLNQQGNGSLPRYLLCSLFGRDEIKLDLTEGLDSWRKRLTSPGRSKDELLPILRPYQRHGCHWLAHLCANGCHGLLADEMGLGKTLQILSLLVAHPVEGKRSIIVCPASVVPVWQSELRKFFPDQLCRILRKGEDFSASDDPCLWIASYTQLRRHKSQLDQIEFGYARARRGPVHQEPRGQGDPSVHEHPGRAPRGPHRYAA